MQQIFLKLKVEQILRFHYYIDVYTVKVLGGLSRFLCLWGLHNLMWGKADEMLKKWRETGFLWSPSPKWD